MNYKNFKMTTIKENATIIALSTYAVIIFAITLTAILS